MLRWSFKLVLLAVVVLATGALAWTIRANRLPQADFTFVNGTEIKSVDPHAISGQPEGRVVHALYEGLCNWDPRSLKPIPGVAERWEISSDGRSYTFHLRENARWSDQSPVTAEDFVYSFRRLLDPETAAEYGNQLWYLTNGGKYTQGDAALRPGDAVEIELHTRTRGALPYARGEVVRGKLKALLPEAKPTAKHAEAKLDAEPFEPEGSLAPAKPVAELASIKELEASERATESVPSAEEPASPVVLPGRVFVVEIAGKERRFRETEDARSPVLADEEPCRRMLLDFNSVGVKAKDAHTLLLTLENPTPYFLSLTGFYPLFPVQRKCLETHGEPNWTRVENLVTNGPYRMVFRRVRDLIRLKKSETYWNRANVRLRTVDILAIESQTTALSLYMRGEVDWLPGIPPTVIKKLMEQERADLVLGDLFATAFFRCNTTREPLEDPRVRRALAMAMDREEIIRTITQADEQPAFSLVPPGIDGYTPEPTFEFDVEKAKALLAEAGYPDGRGFPRVGILYNASEGNAAIAQLLQAQWRQNLGIDVSLQQEEWSSFLARVRRQDYTIVRGGWIGDFADPNTFLELFLSDNPNNQTGWANAKYDKLLAAAQKESKPAARWKLFHEAERILGREMPILPVSFYKSKNLVRPYVKGFYSNAMDTHPLAALSIDYELKARLAEGEALSEAEIQAIQAERQSAGAEASDVPSKPNTATRRIKNLWDSRAASANRSPSASRLQREKYLSSASKERL